MFISLGLCVCNRDKDDFEKAFFYSARLSYVRMAIYLIYIYIYISFYRIYGDRTRAYSYFTRIYNINHFPIGLLFFATYGVLVLYIYIYNT